MPVKQFTPEELQYATQMREADLFYAQEISNYRTFHKQERLTRLRNRKARARAGRGCGHEHGIPGTVGYIPTCILPILHEIKLSRQYIRRQPGGCGTGQLTGTVARVSASH